MESPCKDCKDRHYKCHQKCKPYLDFYDYRRKRNHDLSEEKQRTFWADFGYKSNMRNKKNTY